MTYTYVIMDVSESTYNEIMAELKKAAYHEAFHANGIINLHGLAIRKKEEEPDPLADLPALRSADKELARLFTENPNLKRKKEE